MQGKKVLLVDADSQGDLTTCLGWQDTDSLQQTLSNKLSAVMREEQQDPFSGILSHEEKVDLVPSNLDLSALEMSLVTAMSRESVMKNYLSQVKDRYDYVLIDTEPAKDESFVFSRFPIIPLLLPPLLRLGVELFFFCNEIVIQRAVVLFNDCKEPLGSLLQRVGNHKNSAAKPFLIKGFSLCLRDIAAFVRTVHIAAPCCEHQRWCVISITSLHVNAHYILNLVPWSHFEANTEKLMLYAFFT